MLDRADIKLIIYENTKNHQECNLREKIFNLFWHIRHENHDCYKSQTHIIQPTTTAAAATMLRHMTIKQ